MTNDWSSLTSEVLETLAQADRRLARPGATRGLATARERLDRQFRLTQEHSVASGQTPHPEMLSSVRGWLADLREHLSRDMVRGDRDARATRRANAPIRAGQRVRIKERARKLRGFPEGQFRDYRTGCRRTARAPYNAWRGAVNPLGG